MSNTETVPAEGVRVGSRRPHRSRVPAAKRLQRKCLLCDRSLHLVIDLVLHMQFSDESSSVLASTYVIK